MQVKVFAPTPVTVLVSSDTLQVINSVHQQWYFNGTAFEVYDNCGRVIFQSVISGWVTEIAPSAASGIYYLKINCGSENMVTKLVKL